MPDRLPMDPSKFPLVRRSRRGPARVEDRPEGFRGGVQKALPGVIVAAFVGGTALAVFGTAPSGGTLVLAGALGALGFALAAVVALAGRRRRLRPAQGAASPTRSAGMGSADRGTAGTGRRRTARFSRSRYAPWALAGLAAAAAALSYVFVAPLFSGGRYGPAAILSVVLAPLLVVTVLYDPLAGALDAWLDRRLDGHGLPRDGHRPS